MIPKGTLVWINGLTMEPHEVMGLTEDGRYILDSVTVTRIPMRVMLNHKPFAVSNGLEVMEYGYDYINTHSH